MRAVAGWPVWVVDDSPGGASVGAGATVVRTAGEVGFARAVNIGLEAVQRAGFPLVVVLNDDAAPAPGCIEALIDVFDDGVGAAGPVLYGPEGVESAGFEVSPWGRVRQRRSLGGETAPHEVAALSGAAVLVSSDVRFDERYRHGFEDLALCRDLRRAGKKVLLVPDARCMHLGGATVTRQSRAAQRHALSGHLRYLGGGWRSGVAVGLALAQVLAEGGAPDRLAGLRDGWRDWRRQG